MKVYEDIHFGLVCGALCLLILMGVRSPIAAADSPCPEASKVQEKLTQMFHRPIEVKKVVTTPIQGLCEIQMALGGRNRIVYSDNHLHYLLFGSLFDAETRRNLTRESLDKLNRFKPKEMEKIKKLVSFDLGSPQAPQSLYLVTDPKCPFCKRAEKILEKMAKEGKLRIHFILFPLPGHKGAKEECISIICDKKGYNEFVKGYQGKACDEGKKKVEETVRYLRSRGISATPTFIFPDGFYHAGILSESRIMAHFGKAKNGSIHTEQGREHGLKASSGSKAKEKK